MLGLSAILLAPGETLPLPAPPAGPLHYPSPPSCAWLAVWLLLIAALAAWLARLLWRRWRRHLDALPPPQRRPAAPRRDRAGIASAIAGIRDRHLEDGTYRLGCHELSGALRGHWEERGLARTTGQRFTRMTAREIEGRVGEHPATRLLSLLSELQFGRREPSRDDFQGACELAGELVAKKGAA